MYIYTHTRTYTYTQEDEERQDLLDANSRAFTTASLANVTNSKKKRQRDVNILSQQGPRRQVESVVFLPENMFRRSLLPPGLE